MIAQFLFGWKHRQCRKIKHVFDNNSARIHQHTWNIGNLCLCVRVFDNLHRWLHWTRLEEGDELSAIFDIHVLFLLATRRANLGEAPARWQSRCACARKRFDALAQERDRCPRNFISGSERHRLLPGFQSCQMESKVAWFHSMSATKLTCRAYSRLWTTSNSFLRARRWQRKKRSEKLRLKTRNQNCRTCSVARHNTSTGETFSKSFHRKRTNVFTSIRAPRPDIKSIPNGCISKDLHDGTS